MIAELTPGDLDRVFFCSGGSEAVESALKIAKQVQVLRGFPSGTRSSPGAGRTTAPPLGR